MSEIDFRRSEKETYTDKPTLKGGPPGLFRTDAVLDFKSYFDRNTGARNRMRSEGKSGSEIYKIKPSWTLDHIGWGNEFYRPWDIGNIVFGYASQFSSFGPDGIFGKAMGRTIVKAAGGFVQQSRKFNLDYIYPASVYYPFPNRMMGPNLGDDFRGSHFVQQGFDMWDKEFPN